MRGRGALPVGLLVLATGIAAAGPTSAGSDTGTLSVSVTVQNGCLVSSGSLEFGTYRSNQPDDLDAVGTIEFSDCGGNLVFELDGGTGGTVASRRMSSGSDRVAYQLYRNPTRTAIWGSGADAREVTLLVPQSGSIQVYGRIPRAQAVPAGLYTDSVTITLTF